MNIVESLVDPQWVDANKDNHNVVIIEIDADGVAAYEAGHIPGAIGWEWKTMLWDPLMREFPTPEEFARRLGEHGIENDTTVVFYGDPIEFGFYGWWAFKYCGHRDTRMLDGAKTRWREQGHPLVRTPPRIVRKTYHPVARHETWRATREYVRSKLHDTGTVIIDVRSPEEYLGKTNNLPGKPDFGAERHGHLPGASHLHFVDLLKHDEGFRSRDELQKLFEARGAVSDKEIILYCRRSHRAALGCFALTQILGYPAVRNYDGSWTEWGTIVGFPIER